MIAKQIVWNFAYFIHRVRAHDAHVSRTADVFVFRFLVCLAAESFVRVPMPVPMPMPRLILSQAPNAARISSIWAARIESIPLLCTYCIHLLPTAILLGHWRHFLSSFILVNYTYKLYLDLLLLCALCVVRRCRFSFFLSLILPFFFLSLGPISHALTFSFTSSALPLLTVVGTVVLLWR